MKMNNKAIFEIGKYVCWVDYMVEPRKEPEILDIEFEPKIYAEDIQYKCDVIVPVGSTIGSKNVVLQYLYYCFIDGQSLHELIEREL